MENNEIVDGVEIPSTVEPTKLVPETVEQKEVRLRKEKLDLQRQKLSAIANVIRKDKGKESVILYGDAVELGPVEVVSTGIYFLNQALGVGGWPKGRIVELFGPEGSSKTSIALSGIAEAQAADQLCAFIDTENAILDTWASKLGVDLSRLLISQLNCTEDVFDVVSKCIDLGVSVIVVDSIAGMCPKKELEGDYGDYHIGLNARLIGQAMRKLEEKIRSTKSVVIFINQVRENVGVMFGNPETTPGGRAIKFHSSVRVRVSQTSQLKEEKNVIGIKVRMYVAKNKVSMPFKTVEADFYFDSGFNNELCIFDSAVANKIITTRGSGYFVYNGLTKRRAEWRTILEERPDMLKVLVDQLEGTSAIVKIETPSEEDLDDTYTEAEDV